MVNEPEFNVKNIKEELAKDREDLIERFTQSKLEALPYTRAHSNLVDSYVNRLLEHFLSGFKNEIAVFMLGGNGWRREVYPNSDTDITVVCPNEWDDARKKVFTEAISSFTQALWDVGIKGSAVPRSVQESEHEARSDQSIRTTLEDRRFLWGSQEIVENLDTAMGRLDPALWLKDKIEEGSLRRRKFGMAGYVPCPNVKESGFRELHEMFWVAKAGGFGQGTLDDLIEGQVITAYEKRKINEAHAFFATVRCHIHHIARTENDQLGPVEQLRIAKILTKYKRESDQATIEAFMQDYIKHSRMISFWRGVAVAAAKNKQLEQQGVQPKALGSNDQFVLRDRQLDFVQDPPSLLNTIEIFRVAQEKGYSIHPFALRTMRRHCEQYDEAFFNQSEVQNVLRDILSQTRDIGKVFRDMHAAGLLLHIAPCYAAIDALVDHRPGYQFSVDNRHFEALERMTALETGYLQSFVPDTTNICRAITGDNEEGQSNRRILHFALLLFKTGKGEEKKDFPHLSAQNVRNLGRRFGLNADEIEEATWLVEKQHMMLSTAYEEDLSDPQAIQEFAQAVGSEEKLDRLLVFTVASIMGRGEGHWEAMQNQHIWTLYIKTDALLKPPEAQVSRASIILKQEFNREATRVDFVVPEGTSNVFLRLAKALAFENLNIQDASIEVDENGVSRGSFVVQTPGRKACDAGDYLGILHALEGALERDDILARSFSVRKPKSSDAGYDVHTGVSIENKDGAVSTKVLVRAGNDEPNLLARLLEVFYEQGMHVRSMKTIESAGFLAHQFSQVKDVFFVQDAQSGVPVTDQEKLEKLKEALRQELPEAVPSNV